MQTGKGFSVPLQKQSTRVQHSQLGAIIAKARSYTTSLYSTDNKISPSQQLKQNFQCSDSNITPKVIRQVYAMCILLFTTNHSCSMPLHVLVTDTILCHGGSLQLVRIMNRVGAVVSIDTASRLATSVVSTRISRGIK